MPISAASSSESCGSTAYVLYLQATIPMAESADVGQAIMSTTSPALRLTNRALSVPDICLQRRFHVLVWPSQRSSFRANPLWIPKLESSKYIPIAKVAPLTVPSGPKT